MSTHNTAVASTRIDTICSKIGTLSKTIQATLTKPSTTTTYASVLANPKAASLKLISGQLKPRPPAVPRPKNVEIMLIPLAKEPKKPAFVSSSPQEIVSRFDEVMEKIGYCSFTNEDEFITAHYPMNLALLKMCAS